MKQLIGIFVLISLIVQSNNVHCQIVMDILKIQEDKLVGNKGFDDGVEIDKVFHIVYEGSHNLFPIGEAIVKYTTLNKCVFTVSSKLDAYSFVVGGKLQEKITNDDFNLIMTYSKWMMGYVGNLPNAPIGFFAGVLSVRQSVGVYIDLKFNNFGYTDENTDYYDMSINKAENICEDSRVSEMESRFCIDIGIIKILTPKLGLFRFRILYYFILLSILR